ncbi:MAG: S53 family peptidase [Planctomycetes bacterium]|nr:S53 family peptidase [Planctomycetota bacterium]
MNLRVSAVAWLLLLTLVHIESGSATEPANPQLIPYFQFSKIRPTLPLPRGSSRQPLAFTGDPYWSVEALCRAYHVPGAQTGHGLAGGGVIGIVEFGGGYVQADLDLFSQAFGLPPIVVEDVSVNGGTNEPGSSADVEVTLDIEVAAAAYYHATGTMPTIKVFFAPNVFENFVPLIQAAVDNKCDVLSISWGADEDAWQTYAPGEAERVEATARSATGQGLTIFAASGDGSSSDGETPSTPRVDLPASCPHVIGCGGTSKSPTMEVVWGDGQPGDGGTGGGFSAIFAKQPFQLHAPKAPAGLGRMVPDLSANADPASGYVFAYGSFYGAPGLYAVGGTSCVAPLYAGITAACGRKHGFITPTLWKSPAAFADITQGSNGDYSAATGPDACTGLGVLNGVAYTNLFSSTGQTFTVSVVDNRTGHYHASMSFNDPGLGEYAVIDVDSPSTTGSGTYTQVPPSGVATIVFGVSGRSSEMFFGTYTAVIIDKKATGIPVIFDNTPATITGVGFGLNGSGKFEFYSFKGHD